MAYDYDKLYQSTPDALGAPSQAFVTFFEALPKTPLKVLDVGCGQGRDAIFIAKLGHEVTGIDLSAHGIAQLNAHAKTHGLPLKGIVQDLTEFQPEETFDVIVIDRTLHMLDEDRRLALLRKLANAARDGGWVLIADEPGNLPAFREIFGQGARSWQAVKNKGGYLFCQRQ